MVLVRVSSSRKVGGMLQASAFQTSVKRFPVIFPFKPRFAGEAPPRKYEGLSWAFSRPQSSDVLVHEGGGQTQITSLMDGGQIFTQIDTLLTQAKDSVLVDLYEIQDPQLHPHRTSPKGTPGFDRQQKIVSNLIRLAQQGVKVKVVLDNSFDEEKQEYHNQALIEHLRANGVETVPYPKDAAKISHVKMLVVDNKFAVIGGMNWGNHSATNHDACVLLEGDAVGNLVEEIFKVDYEFGGGDVSTLPAHKTVQDERIKVLTTSPKESPDGGHNEIFEEILHQIDNAQKSIVAELFVLTDKQVAQKLLDAHKRLTANGQAGVQILVDPGLYLKFKNCRPTVDFLREQGVPIRFYKVNWVEEQKLHGKWAVFDEDKLMIGSANWSKTGLQSNGPTNPGFSSQFQFSKGNHEANLLVQSKKLCQAFLRQFDYDWANRSITAPSSRDLFKTVPAAIRDTMFSFGKKAESPPATEKPAAPEKPVLANNVVPFEPLPKANLG